MKIDMSPPAVRQRLERLNELWVLSVKLMKSKKVQTASAPKKEGKEKRA